MKHVPFTVLICPLRTHAGDRGHVDGSIGVGGTFQREAVKSSVPTIKWESEELKESEIT